MAAGKSGYKWQKTGKSGSNPSAPGSFGGYVKPRARPSAYGTTAAQHKVAAAGRETGKTCKGKKGGDFRQCRHEIMKKAFGLSA